MQFNLLHADHGIPADALLEIGSYLQLTSHLMAPGFFIQEHALNSSVPCALYGPAMGDKAIADSEVEMIKRGDREWADRMIDLPERSSFCVQVIGSWDPGVKKFTLYTIYGGPLAPQNPADPDCKDKDEARKFWATHALASRKT